jgi:hypothetical protein
MMVKSVQQGTKPLAFTKLAVAVMLTCLVAPLSLGSAYLPGTIATKATLPFSAGELGRLPIAFEPNAGQTASQVRFMAHAPGGTMYFTPSEVVLSLVSAPAQALDSRKGASSGSPSALASLPSVVRMQFVGSNPTTAMTGDRLLPGKINYLIGNDPSKWNVGLPTYANMIYSGLYPGVDLAYNGTGGQLKGTYTVAPGVDPSLIRWRYDGASSVSVDGAGNLVVVAGAAGGGQAVTVTEIAPVAWQIINGEQKPVSVSYFSQPGNTISFMLGSYDASQPLTIDPTLLYSTYLGANGDDLGLAIASDDAGNVWTTGVTGSTNFPVSPNPGAFQGTKASAFDTFVTKTNTNAVGAPSLVYSTYLGGNGDEYGRGIAVDASGNAYVVGQTASTNFPMVGQYQGDQPGADVFLAKLNAGGTALLYSTYLGGTGSDDGKAIAVSGTQAFVTGSTESPNFPTRNGYYTFEVASDVFVTRINTALTGNASLIYSEIYSGDLFDFGYGIATDGLGNAYVTGDTSSGDLPVTANRLQEHNNGGDFCACDSFLLKLDTNSSGAAAYKYASYIGSVNDDYGRAIAADASGNAYLAGETSGLLYPTSNAFQGYGGNGDGWVLRINTNLTGNAAVTYGTDFGGLWTDAIKGIDIDSAGNIYVAGHTNTPQNVSPPFPLRDAYQSVCGGCYSLANSVGDAFVAKFNPNAATGNASLVYSTYLGGGTVDGSLAPDDTATGLSVDSAGNAYVVGSTNSADFPVVNGYLSNSPYGVGTTDSFIAKLGVAATPTSTPTRTRTPLPLTATRTSTPIQPSATRTSTRTNTPVPPSPTRTRTPVSLTATRTNTPIPPSATRTGTSVAPSATRTATRTNTAVASATRTNTPIQPSPTRTSTPRPTQTPGGPSATPVATNTRIPPSSTRTNTPIAPSATRTRTSLPLTATRTNTPSTIQTATPTETPGVQPCTLQYTDVPANSTFYPFIHCLACQGIISGYQCGGTAEPCDQENNPYFRPNVNVTRGQIAKIVSNSAGYDEDPNPQIYEDVDPSSTFYQWINRLSRRGHIGGYPCGTVPEEPCNSPDDRPYFRPFNNATRGQLAKIVSNAAGFSDTPPDQIFADVLPENGFYMWIQRLASRGIMGGYPCGGAGEPCDDQERPYFRPYNNVTRGQTSKIVSGAFFPNCVSAFP